MPCGPWIDPGPPPPRRRNHRASANTTSRRRTRVRITAHTRATRAYLSPTSAAPTTASHPLSSTPIYRPPRPSLVLLSSVLSCATLRSALRSRLRFGLHGGRGSAETWATMRTAHHTNVSSSTNHRESGLLSRTGTLRRTALLSSPFSLRTLTPRRTAVARVCLPTRAKAGYQAQTWRESYAERNQALSELAAGSSFGWKFPPGRPGSSFAPRNENAARPIRKNRMYART